MPQLLLPKVSPPAATAITFELATRMPLTNSSGSNQPNHRKQLHYSLYAGSTYTAFAHPLL